ncbi:MAG: hypothetical protein ACYSUQ_01355 [Planctomycetota bacterium]|jgi:hypothetical protein
MVQLKLRPRLVGALLAGGCLLSGPCGVTTLQFKDFVTSTLIRTSVTTLTSVLEAATVDAATESGSADEGE